VEVNFAHMPGLASWRNDETRKGIKKLEFTYKSILLHKYSTVLGYFLEHVLDNHPAGLRSKADSMLETLRAEWRSSESDCKAQAGVGLSN
jgi:hypothetical protein